jgi:hypothetical protein
MRLANMNPDRAISLFKVAYGITMEALVADLVAADPLLREYLDHIGGPNREDFRGKGLLGGLTFDVTTEKGVGAHKDPDKRPTYGENSIVVPYQPPW